MEDVIYLYVGNAKAAGIKERMEARDFFIQFRRLMKRKYVVIDSGQPVETENGYLWAPQLSCVAIVVAHICPDYKFLKICNLSRPQGSNDNTVKIPTFEVVFADSCRRGLDLITYADFKLITFVRLPLLSPTVFADGMKRFLRRFKQYDTSAHRRHVAEHRQQIAA